MPQPQLGVSASAELNQLVAEEGNLIATIRNHDAETKKQLAAFEDAKSREMGELETELERVRAAYALQAARTARLYEDESLETITSDIVADMADTLKKHANREERRVDANMSGSLMGTPVSDD